MDAVIDPVRQAQRVGELYAALTHCNRATVASHTSAQLYAEVCRGAVEVGCLRMAWIGRLDPAAGHISPVAAYGAGTECLNGLRIPLDPTQPLARGPTGRAAREGAAVWCQDDRHALDPAAWLAHTHLGWQASAALPIRRQGRVVAVLTLHAGEPSPFDPAACELLETIALTVGHALDAMAHAEASRQAVAMAEAQAEQLQRVLLQTVEVATQLIEIRDPYTAGHQERVAVIATAIANLLGLTADRIEGLRIAALLHDIGKISAPAEILAKPRRLSDAEMTLVRSHPEAGYEVLKNVAFPWPVAEIVLQHHERMDGGGYPRGLRGDAILMEARIVGVCDTVEAMASHRPYRPALGIDAALAAIHQGRGTAFDPAVVDACTTLFRERGFDLPAVG